MECIECELFLKLNYLLSVQYLSNSRILNWPPLIKLDPRKDDLSDELLTGDSCDNHRAATHNRPHFNYFGCNYFLAFSSSDWGFSHQTMKTNNYMMPRGTTRWYFMDVRP